MELYYATTNKGKLLSLKRDLTKYNITIIQASMEIPEPRSSDVQEIAVHKVHYAFNSLKKPVVALDAGFYIPSINGFPRAFVNFALETIGLEGILKLTDGKDRSCEFRECLAYMDSSLNEAKCFVSNVKGILASEPKGVMQEHLWSELGLVFIPEGSTRTLAEMNYDEYLEWRRLFREKNSQNKQFADWIIKNRK